MFIHGVERLLRLPFEPGRADLAVSRRALPGDAARDFQPDRTAARCNRSHRSIGALPKLSTPQAPVKHVRLRRTRQVRSRQCRKITLRRTIFGAANEQIAETASTEK